MLRGLLCAGSHQMCNCCEAARIRVPGPSAFYLVVLSILPSSPTPSWDITGVLMPVYATGKGKEDPDLSQEYVPEGTNRNSTLTTAPENFILCIHTTRRDGGGSSLPGKTQRMWAVWSCSILATCYWIHSSYSNISGEPGRRHSQYSACLSSKRNSIQSPKVI